MTRGRREEEASPELMDEEFGDDDAPAKRRPWGPEEDDHLRELVQIYGIKSWAQIATQLNNRNGKQCRERWRNHLRPELNKGDWSAQEDIDIWERVQEMGTKWAQISEMYMPQRTDNDIKNRWNSIIRKQQHPAGRDWLPDENEARSAILGTASRTQVRRAAGAEGGGQRKRQRVTGTAPLGKLGRSKDLNGDPELLGSVEHDPLAPAASPDGEEDSPDPAGRKLFESPDPVHYDGPGGGQPSSAHGVEDDELVTKRSSRVLDDDDDEGGAGVGLEAVEQAEACRMLVGGEINADTFDVEAFLPVAAAAMGSLSQMSSPIGELKNRPLSRGVATTASAMAQDWFDPELDSSLSPILTPSLRHQLRAWMASRSPTNPTNATPRSASAMGVTPGSRVLGLTAALTAASSSLTSAVSSTLSTLGASPAKSLLKTTTPDTPLSASLQTPVPPPQALTTSI